MSTPSVVLVDYTVVCRLTTDTYSPTIRTFQAADAAVAFADSMRELGYYASISVTGHVDGYGRRPGAPPRVRSEAEGR